MRRLHLSALAFALALPLLARADPRGASHEKHVHAREHGAEHAAARVRARDAYIRLPPPGQSNAVAFMTLESADGKAHDWVSVSLSICKHASLHTHRNENGVMRMSKVDKITIPAEGSVALAPGGLHVMIMGLTQKLAVGQKVPIVMRFADGKEQTVTAIVKGL